MSKNNLNESNIDYKYMWIKCKCGLKYQIEKTSDLIDKMEKLNNPSEFKFDDCPGCNPKKYISFCDFKPFDCVNTEYKIRFKTNKSENLLKDSGERTTFPSGAIREVYSGKGRCDLIPLNVLSSIIYYNSKRENNDHFGMPLEKPKFTNEDYPVIIRGIIDRLECFRVQKDVTMLYDLLIGFCVTFFGDIYSGLLEVSFQYGAGANKYSDNNWKLGIPLNVFLNSAIRHLLKFLRGDSDEQHARAFIWNIIGLIWTKENKPELDNIETI